MSIYSTNRSGTIAFDTTPLNEDYLGEDIGIIMSETEKNDMAFFEAIMYSDFAEIQGLREGTLLEADAKEANKKSIKSYGEQIGKALSKFWAKIQALFRSAMEKIAAYTGSDGKKVYNSLAAAIKANGGWSGKVEGVTRYDLLDNVFLVPAGVSNFDFKAPTAPENASSKDFVKKYLRMRIDSDDVTPGNYVKKALEKARKVETMSSSNYTDWASTITDAKFNIKTLKEYEKSAKKTIDAGASAVRKACGMNITNIAALNSQVSALQTVVSTICRAGIAASRANIGATRVAFAKALASVRKESKAKHEMAVMEAVDEINIAFTCPITVTPEISRIVEAALID